MWALKNTDDLLLWGNAYAQIVRDGKNTVLGLYPLLPENVEVDRDESGELYYIYHAYTDEVPGEQKSKDANTYLLRHCILKRKMLKVVSCPLTITRMR